MLYTNALENIRSLLLLLVWWWEIIEEGKENDVIFIIIHNIILSSYNNSFTILIVNMPIKGIMYTFFIRRKGKN